MKTKKTKLNNTDKALLKMIKEMKSDRHLYQKRVNDFNSELAKDIARHNVLLEELGKLAGRIQNNQHLIKMYSVIDDHDIMDIWRLESAAGLTTKKYPDWKFDFEKTKDGFKLKK